MIGLPQHLLYNIVKIFALADFYSSIIFFIIPIDPSFISSTFIYIDHARPTITADGFVNETRRSFGITLCGDKTAQSRQLHGKVTHHYHLKSNNNLSIFHRYVTRAKRLNQSA